MFRTDSQRAWQLVDSQVEGMHPDEWFIGYGDEDGAGYVREASACDAYQHEVETLCTLYDDYADALQRDESIEFIRLNEDTTGADACADCDSFVCVCNLNEDEWNALYDD